MRLWSLHPRLLDAKGLTALWREALLARAVLRGRTKGYTLHPQLARFRACGRPVAALNRYLETVHAEASGRGYAFDSAKLGRGGFKAMIPVTRGQVVFERGHLLAKLYKRDRRAWAALRREALPPVHPLFEVVNGPVEPWEKQGHRVSR